MRECIGIVPLQKVCEACQRSFPSGHELEVKGRLCRDCFLQWYDPDNGSFDNCNPRELGNYVRKMNGLPPLETA